MRIAFLFFLNTIGLCTCQEKSKIDHSQSKFNPISVTDTIIGCKNITDEIAGSAYRKRAKSYFIIVKKDTSDFKCILTEAKEGGKVNLFLNLPYSRRTITYRQVKTELKLILLAANKDFNFDSLNSISYGRLILSGDLAVSISKEYLEKFGAAEMEKAPDYRKIAEFLNKSSLVRDVDSIFKPYSISVKNVSFEKAFFTTKKDLFWASKVETDSDKVPEKILDCITYVTLRATK